MARHTMERVVQDSQKAWARKQMWVGIVDEAFLYAAPGMNPYVGDGSFGAPVDHDLTAGQERHDHLFDGTASVSAEKLAALMIMRAFPPGQDWAEMSPGPMFATDETPGAKIRKAIQSIQFKSFRTLNASNFYLEANKMGMDGVIAGTGVLHARLSTDATRFMEFEAVSQAEIALTGGPLGQVWGLDRIFKLNREEIEVVWPDAQELPDMVDVDNQPPRMQVNQQFYYDPKEYLWREVVWRGGGSEKGHGGSMAVMYEDETPLLPWLIWRYMLLPGEVQGRSPMFKALPSARTVNHAKRVRLEAASLRAVPSYTVRDDDSVNINTLEIASGILIPVDSNERGNPTIAELPMTGDVNLNELVIEDEQNSIREALLDNRLPPPTGAVRSATEIIERQREAQEALGLPYLRLIEEIGRPLLRLVIYYLGRAGKMEELQDFGQLDEEGLPQPLMLDGSDVQVEFNSPLIQAQRLSDAQTITQWGESVARAFGPEALIAGAEVEKVAGVLAKKMNIPQELIRKADPAAQLLQQQVAGTGPASPAGLPGGMGP